MEADVSLKCAIFGVTWALHAGSELLRTPSRRRSLRLRARPPQPASGTADNEPHPLRYSANLRLSSIPPLMLRRYLFERLGNGLTKLVLERVNERSVRG